MGKMTHLLDENISGNDLIKIYNAQKAKKINFSRLLIPLGNKDLKLMFAGGLNTSIVNILIGLSLPV
jgi:subfamily B ATP-binding cassette protein MsbA